MKHTYHIQGMTCNGCRSKVEQLLTEVERVTSVAVDLEKAQAVVETSEPVNIKTFQEVLPAKYSITEVTQKNISNTVEEQKSEWRQLTPLFLIFGYITVASVLLNQDSWQGFMLDFMGLFYVVFSFFKMLDLKGFPQSFRMYDPLAKAIPVYGWIYPFIETVLALLFLMRFEIEIALIVTIVILGITTIGVTRVLLSKKSIQCACLGTALKLPMTKATFIENTIMLVMAIIMLINNMGL
ncbi:heavy metal-associated domain-containing protein [Aquimarina sp. MMG016]|uniref:heavy-metal-associated domain-containing protein n=1 Tax=Aquimarina sp. MMG016 TaxID=2822690 RepID=UPI001B3A63C4|nr:heavy metal-associated domain-containing protein [Aquimarina sp. MMG016]MBQ4820799.1 cation transporter [Aquimarina sp. MMG016]